MPNNEYPVLNGIAPSWADVIIRIKPTDAPLIEVIDVAAVSSSSSLEIGKQRGASGGRVLKRTTGAVDYESSITFYRSGWQKLLRGLKDAAPLRGNQRLISLVFFQVQVQHTPPNDIEIYERRIKGCRITGQTLALAEGTDADQLEIPLSPLEIVDMIDGEECLLI